jgi:hypothetical protein
MSKFSLQQNLRKMSIFTFALSRNVVTLDMFSFSSYCHVIFLSSSFLCQQPRP